MSDFEKAHHGIVRVAEELCRLRAVNAELLAALEEALEAYLGTEYYEPPVIERMRAAIARAKA